MINLRVCVCVCVFPGKLEVKHLPAHPVLSLNLTCPRHPDRAKESSRQTKGQTPQNGNGSFPLGNGYFSLSHKATQI